MAKSLRAKSCLKAKSVKRKDEFQNAVNARELRISEKLKQDLINQKLKELKSKNGTDGESNEPAMEIDDLASLEKKEETKTQKISTSGWRDARHLNYKRAKKMKKNKKKGSFTRF
ncbi:uncharacterized protein PWA37_003798 [Arxiozyma heterogenica]|uniref:DUF2423 domain-containing protein n=1 Tax=Arxiozyma heterogenica TaxID=278026 RepID=A0AAN7WKA2_9SACH|nr:hypothetical protein RI543_004909 [Kazachstania heterogenica]